MVHIQRKVVKDEYFLILAGTLRNHSGIENHWRFGELSVPAYIEGISSYTRETNKIECMTPEESFFPNKIYPGFGARNIQGVHWHLLARF